MSNIVQYRYRYTGYVENTAVRDTVDNIRVYMEESSDVQGIYDISVFQKKKRYKVGVMQILPLTQGKMAKAVMFQLFQYVIILIKFEKHVVLCTYLLPYFHLMKWIYGTIFLLK